MDSQQFSNQNRSLNNGDKMWILSHQGRGPGPSPESSGIGLFQFKEAHDQPLGSDDSSAMDVSESYTRSEVACGTSKNLHFKALAGQDLLPGPPSNQSGGDVEMDIDKKQALRKLAERTKSQEETFPQVSLLNIQHKKRPQKRTSTSVELTHEDLQALNAVKLKTTEGLLKSINLGQPPTEPACITYNDKCFSSSNNLQLEKRLSSGNFGDVFKVFDKVTGKTLILKEIKRNKGRIEVDSNEVMIPTKFTQVQNIAQVYGLVWTGAHLHFILEDAGISLRLMVDSPEYVILLDGAGKKESIMRDIFCAISHLAKQIITHCDIKPENVCVDIQSWTAKLIDFGSSKTMMDAINYKGVTPEYLDPLVNKIICDIMEKKVSATHRLNEKDDVFSAGLCFLFMVKRCHPLIHFITTRTDYPPNMTPNMRLQVLKKISQLDEQEMARLRDVPMSDHMKSLMVGTLSLDRDLRWGATQAMLFIDGEGGSSVQPPQKQSRPDSRPSYTFKLEDLSMYVDVSNKNASITAPTPAKLPDHSPGSRSPEAALGLDRQEGLGINMKANILHQPTGQILYHPKLRDFPRQEGPQLLPGASTCQISTDSRQPHTGQQQGQPPQMMSPPSRPSLQDQESREYEDLVSSFQTKMPTPKMSRRLLPAEATQQPPHSTSQCDQPATCTRQEVASKLLPVTSILLPAEVQQRASGTYTGHNLGGQVRCNEQEASQGLRRVVMQDDQRPYLDLGSVVRQDGQHAIQGLSGRVVRYEGRCDPPVGNMCGNLPDMDALFPGEEEQLRPKLKGLRRFRISHD